MNRLSISGLTLIIMFLLSGVSFNPALAHDLDEPGGPLSTGQPVADFSLIDQDGLIFNLESVRGKAIVVSFIYTKCPDVCPLLTTYMRQTRDLLGDKLGRDVVFVSISFDNEDTPEILKKYASVYGVDSSGWKFLSSPDEDEIRHTVNDFGILYEKDEDGFFSHSMFTYLLDNDLTVSKVYLGTFLNPDEVAKDISDLVSSPLNLTLPLLAGFAVGFPVIGLLVYLRRKKSNA